MIEDVPGSPVVISGVQTEAEEHQALLKSVQQKSFLVFCLMKLVYALRHQEKEDMMQDNLLNKEYKDPFKG